MYYSPPPWCIELDLEAGDHAAILHELESLAQAHPVNERLRAHLMLALYRSGREAEALAVYSDVRRRLNEEVGVDPGPELTRLQQRTAGRIGSLTRLIRQAAITAISDGTERITKTTLDTIRLDHLAETHHRPRRGR
ncbi:AfsR/SARP family transcriptional regulator [Streptomyces halstedii]|uniref:AfsR/SARP family transcriptional regulator n=1 Tax=Streptomyces halstedii TaxID=1944 RepID=UPI0038219AD3